MDEEGAPERQEEEEQGPERLPEGLKIRGSLRAGLIVFGPVVFAFGVLSLLGGRLEYANFVTQQVIGPLAIIVGGIMLFAGIRGQIWS